MKKSFFLIAAMLVMTTFAMGQSTGLIVDNKSNYDVYYTLYGDNVVCGTSHQSSAMLIPANTAAAFTDPSGPIPTLSATDVFTMIGLYDTNPTTNVCGTGTLQVYFSGCGALGNGAGPSMQTVLNPLGLLCVTSSVTVQWQNNTPAAGTSTVLIQ